MPPKKHNQKKDSTPSVSEEENAQIQQMLADYPKIAAALHEILTIKQGEEALIPITSLSQGAQILLLKAFAKEKTAQAADVLLALSTLAPNKEARKEAHRSLIRLEEFRCYPTWTPPLPPAPALTVLAPTVAPRFWKGQVTRSEEMGEMQLLLLWEQGEQYKEVRIFGFLLELWSEGVKDFFTEVSSKHEITKRLDYMRSQLGSIPLAPCTLLEGKHLLEKALKVNRQRGSKPHPDYTRHLPLVHQLLLDIPDTQDSSDSSEDLDTNQLLAPRILNITDQLLNLEEEPEEVVAGFLNAWLSEDYETAYTALAIASPLRAGLSSEAWIAQRLAWSKQAHPAQGKSEIVYQFDDDFDDLDDDEDDDLDDETFDEETFVSSILATKTPGVENIVPLISTTTEDLDEDDDDDEDLDEDEDEDLDDDTAEIEAFWSLTLIETEVTLPELPQATAVYKATGRHWFWAKYLLVFEEDEWRIQDMTDAGTAALTLPREELDQQLAEIIEFASEQLDLFDADTTDDDEELDEDLDGELDNDLDDDLDEDDEDEIDEDEEFAELTERFEEMKWMTMRAMHYTDALITQSPDDPALYNMGYDQASAILENERPASYIEMQAERFPELRGTALRKLAMAHINIASSYEESADEKQASTFLILAEKTLRASLALEDTVLGNILLAETLIVQNKQLDEAERLLQQALAKPNIETKEASLAEADLGRLAQNRGAKEAALNHYLRAAAIRPDQPGIWFSVGFMQRQLGHNADAEQSYRRSIDEDPDETEAYTELASIYTSQGKLQQAEEILEEGLEINPDAADLLAGMALYFIEKGDLPNAKEYLEEAEGIDEDLEIVQAVRQRYNAKRSQHQQQLKGKSRKSKRR